MRLLIQLRDGIVEEGLFLNASTMLMLLTSPE
jgi:hypothetical protein